MNHKLNNILKKYKLLGFVFGLALIMIGTIQNESYETELKNGGLIFICFSLGAFLIGYSLFRFKIRDFPFIGILGGLLTLFISIKLIDLVESLMIDRNINEIKGIIIEKSCSSPVKGIDESWNYTYEFKINNKTYMKRVNYNVDCFRQNDSVKIEYCGEFPIFSRIKDNEKN